MERFSETVEIQTFFAITYQILHINPLIKLRIKDGFCVKIHGPVCITGHKEVIIIWT